MGNAASIGRELRQHLSKTMSEVMLVVQSNLVNATPVDTEHAASNWVLSVGSPYTGVDGSKDAVSWSAAEAGIREVQQYDIGRDGPSVYIRNNVLYLRYLDRGWSQQAPPGFVAKAIMAAQWRAPAQRAAAVHRTLRNISHAAYIRTY